jgi:hypothetical protein
MNSIGKILVHLDDSHDGVLRLEVAKNVPHLRTLSGGPMSEIVAVYSTMPGYLEVSSSYSEYAASDAAILMEADELRKAQVTTGFDQWSVELGRRVSWLSDLLVLAQHNPSDKGLLSTAWYPMIVSVLYEVH